MTIKMALPQKLIHSEPYQLIFLVLVLQIVSLFGADQLLGQLFFIAHVGAVLMWQPFIKKERVFGLRQCLALIVFLVTLLLMLNSWVLSLWMVLLIGMISGRVSVEERTSWSRLVILAMLLCHLLLFALPDALETMIFHSYFEYGLHGLMLFGLGIIAVMNKSGEDKESITDIFQSINAVLLVSYIAMGTLVAYGFFGLGYIPALMVWLLGSSLVILLLFLIFTPRMGSRGMRYLVEHYLFKMNTSVERWLTYVTEISYNKKFTPDQFVELAAKELIKITWVRGLLWYGDNHEEIVGGVSPHVIEQSGAERHYRLYTEGEFGPTLLFHAQWLLKLLDLLYSAKMHEYRLAEQTKLKAIYETGAKLTHDIKNILQGLSALTEMVADDEDNSAMPLIKRQLPSLEQRLQQTLYKLNAPSMDETRQGVVEEWWQLVIARYAGRHIEFASVDYQVEDGSKRLLYVDVLDSIVENLLENARKKRQGGEAIVISAQLMIADEFSLTVTDDGEAVPVEMEHVLFQQAIPSKSGYGIGLYQAYKSAMRVGYRLSLDHNQSGCVRFVVTGPCLERDGK